MPGGEKEPDPPDDVRPERGALGSALARLRIFGPGTTMCSSDAISLCGGLNGSGLGFRNAGQEPSGSSARGSPDRSATLTT